jgi:hypothetical protein
VAKKRKNARSVAKKRRNLASKKGWVTRRKKKVRITIGYSSSKENSWYLTVNIGTYKKLSDSNIAEVVARLAGDGHFDGMAPIDNESDKTPADYQFCTFFNFELVKKRAIQIKKGHAVLYSWYRNEAYL